MRETLVPIGSHNTLTGQEVDVGGGVHGHHIGIQTVVHGARLCAGAAMGLVNLQVSASCLFVIGHEGGVVFLVKLAGYVVGGVEQGLG